jgi:dienelactone hydrolase
MAEVVLFHHVLGRTDGLQAFADKLRASGHTVHLPDLFDGRTFDALEDGMAYARQLGDAVDERADAAVAELPSALVYAGFSLGAASAQRIAQTRPGAAGVVLYDSCISLTAEWSFGPWPEGLPVQIHGMDQDPIFALEGDLDAARELVDHVGPELGELYLYPGDGHLFADPSAPGYDSEAAALATERTLAFLARVVT